MVMNPEKAVIDIARIARVLLVSMIYPTPQDHHRRRNEHSAA